MSVLLEVCIDSMASARAAREGGADRLEVCSSLASQGTTPSFGLTQQCVAAVGLPVMMMIRPHDGTFVYTAADLEIMVRDIEIAKSLGVQGVVFGALTDEGDVHASQCARLIRAAGGLDTTFHRAFDVTRVPRDALERLVDLGFDRILTSGQESSAVDGIPLLRRLNRQANGRIRLVAGAGINPANARQIVTQTGIRELHASAARQLPRHAADGKLTFGTGRQVTDADVVRAIREQAT